MNNKVLPKIKSIKTIAKSKLFTVESLELLFSNGAQRTYERMKPSGREAVMIAPITDENELILIKEYSAGTNAYELGFPKGLIDLGETAEQAAVRELKEEIGFGARQLFELKRVTIAPSYFSSVMVLFIATDLYAETLIGDEPEPLEIIKWPLNEIDALIDNPEFWEARSLVTLLLLQKKLNESR